MDKPEVALDSPYQIDDSQVVRYLQEQPDFFIRNASLIEQLTIPHAIQGAISLPEAVMNRQRLKIKQLEQDICFMVEQAHENGQLFDELLYLVIEMSMAQSLSDMLNSLNRWAKKLGLSGASVRLFSDCWRLSAPLDAQALVRVSTCI